MSSSSTKNAAPIHSTRRPVGGYPRKSPRWSPEKRTLAAADGPCAISSSTHRWRERGRWARSETRLSTCPRQPTPRRIATSQGQRKHAVECCDRREAHRLWGCEPTMTAAFSRVQSLRTPIFNVASHFSGSPWPSCSPKNASDASFPHMSMMSPEPAGWR